MFVRVKNNPHSYRKSILVCYSKRINNKPRQFVIKNFGIARAEEDIQNLKHLAEVWLMDFKKSFSITNLNEVPTAPTMKEPIFLPHIMAIGRVNISMLEIMQKMYEELEFKKLLTKEDTEILIKTLCIRLYEPASKRRTSYLIDKKFSCKISPDSIYRMLDKLWEQKTKIESKIFNKTLKETNGNIDLMFFDVTTLSFETNTEDELRAFGFSKDQKSHHVQVVLALATTNSGLPIGYKLFPGNTAEVNTLIECVDYWKANINMGDVTIVADRAMLSKKNLECLNKHNIKYIVACPLRKLSNDLKEEVMSCIGYNLQDCCGAISWIKEIPLKQEQRLIVTYNRSRHCKDQKDREKTIARLLKKLGKTKNVKKLVSNANMLKYIDIDGESFGNINEDKVAEAARWDGIHGVITNCELKAVDIVSKYKNLWVIEESFRIEKHDLEIRPIYHYKPQRIEAHILLCFISFAIIRFIQKKLNDKGYKYSIRNILDYINDVEAIVVHDTLLQEHYRLLSMPSEEIKTIYEVMNLPNGKKVASTYYEEYKYEKPKEDKEYEYYL
jgi:transposase